MIIKYFFRRKNKPTSPLVEGNLLILPQGKNTLPHRCIYCNKQVDKLIAIKLYNDIASDMFLYSFLIYPVIEFFIAFFFYFFDQAAIALNKRNILYLGICRKHKIYRVIKRYMACVSMIIGIILVYNVNVGNLSGIFTIIGLLMTLFFFIYLCRISYILKVKEIKNKLVYIEGCNKLFLDSLSKDS